MFFRLLYFAIPFCAGTTKKPLRLVKSTRMTILKMFMNRNYESLNFLKFEVDTSTIVSTISCFVG